LRLLVSRRHESDNFEQTSFMDAKNIGQHAYWIYSNCDLHTREIWAGQNNLLLFLSLSSFTQ